MNQICKVVTLFETLKKSVNKKIKLKSRDWLSVIWNPSAQNAPSIFRHFLSWGLL